jgi:phospholipid/cholesterol/gamma-HCH transport system permease protein
MEMFLGLFNYFFQFGKMTAFLMKFFALVWKPPYKFNELLWQMFYLGYKSLFLVGTAAFIIGLVMTIQLIPTMENYGAEQMVPNMVAISMIREIGPVVTALVVSGKVSSAIGAEIGSMKVTEQIDSMSISGVDPYHYLVITRVLATTITLPLLVIFAGGIAMIGSYVGVNLKMDMSTNMFISIAFDYVYFYDVTPSIIKSFVFGFVVGIVGCFYGYKAEKGTAGVGRAAHRSVVTSSLLFFFVDLVSAEISQWFIP